MTVRWYSPQKLTNVPWKALRLEDYPFYLLSHGPLFRGHSFTSWWFFTNPFEKYAKPSNWIISPKNRVENKKYLKPPPTPRIIEWTLLFWGVWICMTQGLGISKPLVTWDPMILRVLHFQGYIILNMFLVFSKIFPKNQAPRTGIREKTLVIWLGRHLFLCPKMSSLVQGFVVFLH